MLDPDQTQILEINLTPCRVEGVSGIFITLQPLAFGYSEFITKWGERRLEDNWRRKNKRQIILDDERMEKKKTFTAKNIIWI